MKKTIIQVIVIIILLGVLGGLLWYALKSDNNISNSNQNQGPSQSQMPGGPRGMGGLHGENSSSSSVESSGKTEISDTQTITNTNYESSEGSQNALLVKTGGNVTLTKSSITKTGDSSDENADFYGTNAGILVNNNGKLNISDSTITTNGSHANGLFVYGTGEANVKNLSINTSSNMSGGIMVAGGGTLSAEDLKVTTEGNSSAAIRSDRGGGTMTITGGDYTTNGVGSPAIYSTADITVKNANLTATKSEGAVVEGKNSITLSNCTLTDTNTTLNGNSETYKNIFLYQSMSGDADTGTAKFTAENSTITTNKGDTIFVTNTTAEVNLTNNKIVNNDGDFLRIQAGKWGNSGSNGGDVTLNMKKQEASGNIIVDNISTLVMNLTENSNYKGTINSANTAKSIALKLDSSSKITLTGDSYITSLEDIDSSYSNINFNGYKLYVNGTAIN
ncbi:MAG: hypothetical protein IJK18_02405 [Clostridia bacterium]|nr:hypothetical protein [Clostridia bacterium]